MVKPSSPVWRGSNFIKSKFILDLISKVVTFFNAPPPPPTSITRALIEEIQSSAQQMSFEIQST